MNAYDKRFNHNHHFEGEKSVYNTSADAIAIGLLIQLKAIEK